MQLAKMSFYYIDKKLYRHGLQFRYNIWDILWTILFEFQIKLVKLVYKILFLHEYAARDRKVWEFQGESDLAVGVDFQS